MIASSPPACALQSCAIRQGASYNGSKNYETWSVSLWVNNDQGLYRAMREQREDRLFTGETAEAFCREAFPGGTPDMHHPSEMKLVDWEEIATAFNAG